MSEGRYKYASAPYNFIPLPEKVVYRHSIPWEKSENTNETEKILLEIQNKYGIDKLPTHDKFHRDLKTGYIDYTVTAKTPLFISNGNGEFFNINGNYSIPGSTIRGKVTTNAEILSWANPEFIRDDKLWYREIFNKNILKIMYSDFVNSNGEGITKAVKAGYITKKYNKYIIYPAKQNNKCESFEKVHESKLRRSYKKIHDGLEKEIFMYKLKGRDTQEFLWEKFYDFKNKIGDLNKKINELTMDDDIKAKLKKQKEDIKKEMEKLLSKNKRKFRPYYCRILYDKKSKIITKIVKDTDNDEYGILINSSNLKNKQNHYIIYEKDNSSIGIVVAKKIIDQFNTSVKYIQEEVSEKFCLPEENEIKPVFYIANKNNEVINLGFTPYLKIPYEKSVCDGIDTEKNYENIFLDYVQSIFGLTDFKYKYDKRNKSMSYKGRVSFTNARLIESENIKFENNVKKSLMSPKISSFQLYLNQDKIENYKYNLSKYKNDLKTYDGDFELRGYKFYWLRNECDNNDDYERSKNQKVDQFVNLKAVKMGTEFKGRIYFENLTEDELGLLIMSIKPFQGALDNFGQGKPYGFGKVEFNIDGIYEMNIKEIFKKFNVRKEDYLKLKDKEIEECKNEFKEFMKRQDIKFEPMENNRLKCFCISKYKEQDIRDKEFRYIDFENEKNMFVDRNVLKSMEDYTDKDYANMVNIINANISKNQNKMDLEKILGSKFKVSKRGNH